MCNDIRGRTLFRRSQRVALNARFLLVVFSMAFGLRCCSFLTALDRASGSSSSSSAGLEARDLRSKRRQIFFSFPSPSFFTSFLRSQARGILASGRVFGSRNAASLWAHVWSKPAACAGWARLRGEGTMAATGYIMLRLTISICRHTIQGPISVAGTAGNGALGVV